MNDWITDERPENTRRFGDMTLVSQTHKQDRTTAHLVTFPDGRQLRVLPGFESGQRRARIIRQALEAASDPDGGLVGLSVDLVEPYIVGCIAGAGLMWEQVGNIREVTIEEWLEEWFGEWESHRANTLLAYLKADGWKIVRAE